MPVVTSQRADFQKCMFSQVKEVKVVLSSSSLTFFIVRKTLSFAESEAREKEPLSFKCLSLLLLVVVLLIFT